MQSPTLSTTRRLLGSRGSRWLGLLYLVSWYADASAHGGVVLEEDLCVIELGFFRAHFTIYQPETRGSEEFCEDIPDVTETIFVMDYLHDSMREVPVDFRIIRDVQDLGVFAKWEDVEKIEDIASATVFYQPPVTRRDAVFQVEHRFAEAGQYIGIVTTRHPTLERTYNTVFPFRVGGSDHRVLALFIVLVVLIQGHFWISRGGAARLRARLNAG
jgi:hypothetical protein